MKILENGILKNKENVKARLLIVLNKTDQN
jgi:hypothetical protein